MIKILKGGEWVDGTPDDGEKVRKYDSAGGFAQYTHYKESIAKRNKIVVTSHNKRLLAEIGQSPEVTIEFRDGNDNLIPINDSFAMPVGRVGGSNYRTLLMSFVDGVCIKTVQWNDAGEFEITKEMINMHLGESEKLDFDGFNISVAE